MQEITQILLEEYMDLKVFDLAKAMFTGTRFFDVDNIQDLLNNYEELSYLQHQPRWLTLEGMDLNKEDEKGLKDWHRVMAHFAEIAKSNLRIEDISTYAAIFRTSPFYVEENEMFVENKYFFDEQKTFPVRLTKMTGLILENEPSKIENNLYSAYIFSLSDSTGSIDCVAALYDMMGFGHKDQNEYTSFLRMGSALPLVQGTTYSVLAQALPNRYKVNQDYFGNSQPKIRIHKIEKSDSGSRREQIEVFQGDLVFA